MPAITSIALTDLKPLANWTGATVGSIVQCVHVKSGASLVGLRCELKLAGNLPRPYFLVLEGTGDVSRGALLEPNELNLDAIDVSLLYEIRVQLTPPSRFSTEHRLAQGVVCESSAGSGEILIRTMEANGRPIFIWLVDPTSEAPSGTAETPPPPEPLVIGFVEVRERIDKDISGSLPLSRSGS